MFSRHSPLLLPTITSRAVDVAPRQSARRIRPELKLLESRDATGSMVGGVVAAALGSGITNPLDRLAALTGDWALSPNGPVVSAESQSPSDPAEDRPRRLTPFDTWLDPQLIWPEERHEIRITANPPADLVRRADLDDIFTRSTFGVSETAGIGNGVTARFQTPGVDRSPSSGGGAAPVANSDTLLSPASLFLSPAGPGLIPAAPVMAPVGMNAAASRANSRTSADAIELYDEPPNQAPQAVDDAITVDEDQSIVFNPTANDTDPDGDPLWVKSVQADTGYGRTFWEEGGLIRYIPNPNIDNTTTGYSPPDSFTYTVTDGLAEATATVSVTVTAVNDAPEAFNDAAVFLNTYTAPPDPNNPDALVSLYSIGGDTNLFTNDIDFDGFDSNYDGQVLQIAATDMTGTVGQVTISPAGDVQWSVPWDYTGATEFRYKVIDDQGGESDWATMKLWSVSSLDAPPVTANADDLAIGDDPLAGNVLSNDSGGAVAVLTSHPGSGQLTSFNMDGSFNYLPGLNRGGWFGYRLFSADGEAWAETKANMTGVNLTIYHGQGGTAVSELNERIIPNGAPSNNPLIPAFKGTGAFTVANLNDSNVNTVVDSAEANITANPNFPGSGEVDLMRLTMTKPVQPIGNNKVTLSVTPGAVNTVRIWNTAAKGGGDPVLVADGADKTVEFAVDDKFPGDLWVELAGASQTVGDVTITMTYAGASDTVNASGIWTKNEQTAPYWPTGYFMNDNNAPGLRTIGGVRYLPEDADAKYLDLAFKQEGRSLGLINRVAVGGGWYISQNVEVSKFTALPSGLTPYSILRVFSFDASRSNDRIGTMTKSDGTNTAQFNDRKPAPGWLDTANDESGQFSVALQSDIDNDDDLVYGFGTKSTDNIYAIDAPGTGRWIPTANRVLQPNDDGKTYYILVDDIYRSIFFDFVRVRIGQPWTFGPGLQGSRSSVYYFWSSMSHLSEDQPAIAGGLWYMKRVDAPGTTTENRIAPGSINIAVAGGGV